MMRVNWPQMVIDEQKGRPFNEEKTYYRRLFANLRKLARPALNELRDEDLRKIAMTWMHSAGATDTEAAAVSGHAEASMAQMKRHYVHRNAEQANNAMAKLAIWLEAQGAKL